MPKLTIERLKQVLHYSPATGVFTRKIPEHVRMFGKTCDCADARGYLRVSVDGERFRLNRLAWFYMTGAWPQGEVDHKNTERQDNRWTNLRDVSGSVNMQNRRRARRGNTSGLLGVSRYWKRFRAQIQIDGRNCYLGTFATAEEAHSVYLSAKRMHHPGNTL